MEVRQRMGISVIKSLDKNWQISNKETNKEKHKFRRGK